MASSIQPAFEFGPFLVDPQTRRLLRQGSNIPLTPKAFDTLIILLNNQGRVVHKDELMKQLWPDTYVEEGNLAVQIFTLRRALGDDSQDSAYIETVPRLGYRFTAVARSIDAENTLVVQRRSSIRTIRETVEESELGSVSGARFLAWTVVAILLAGVLTLTAGQYWFSKAGRASGPPVDIEAQQLHAQARELWSRREAFDEAESLIRQAIQRSPNFAAAYVTLAEIRAIGASPAAGAEEAARKAIELDPSMGEPHAVLGFIRLIHDWNWAAADEEFRRAVKLSPRYATAHHWYSVYFSLKGQHAEALSEIRKAMALDPTSHLLAADLCDIFLQARDYTRAIDQCRRVVMQGRGRGARSLYLAYLHGGYPDKAVTVLLEFEGSPELQEAYQRGGFREFLRKWIDALDYPENPSSAYFIAEAYALLGEREQALFWLEKACDQHNFFMPWIGVNASFDSLRNEPRFQKLMQRVGLAQ